MGIINEEELKSIVAGLNQTAYMPGVRKDLSLCDSHEFENLKSGEFCANLHIHSQYSDGLISVEKLLNHANGIANRNGHFLMAITDHDTMDGAKEISEIVNKNPDKYKNLKIVLGVEISTIATRFKNQTAPVDIHTLVYGIDPFDKRLDELLAEKRRLKFKLMNETIARLNKEVPDNNFNLQEAAKIHEMVLKGQDEISHPLKKYTAAKILFEHYVKDKEGRSLERPARMYKHLFKMGNPYYKAYKTALELYLGKELDDVPQNLVDSIMKAKAICEENHPSMTRMQDAFTPFEETLEFVSGLKQGSMCIAHPARINVKRINASMEDFYTELFEKFKKHGGEKACFYEGYYYSYEGGGYLDIMPSVLAAVKPFDLISTGGLDSHGPNIIQRCPYS